MTRTDTYILSLDQGTTSSRAIVFDRTGCAVAVSQIPFTQIFPKPGWVEHDPEEIWKTQLEATRGALAAAGVGADRIDAVGITNQRETTLLWDRDTGRPVYNAIVWQCRRSSDICQALKQRGLSPLVKEKTGLVLDPYFSGTKLMWLFDEIPGLKKRAEKGEILFGTVDTWLNYRLTGVHATDPTNASRTLLFNIRDGVWDRDLLGIFGIPEAILPEVRPSSGYFGETRAEWFGSRIRVTGCAGDQQAALFGHACFEPGMAKNTYGTGCFTLMNTGDQPVVSGHNLLTTIAWDLGKGFTYALEGSVFIGGAVIQWLRDQMGLIADAAESEQLARSVEDTGGVYVVPAFVGLGAPYWDSDARGTIVGITRGTTRAHLVRAALESIAFQSRDLLEAMESDFGRKIPLVKADGGASVNGFLMQFQSDILDRTIVLPETGETTALGAAYLAGLATGYWESPGDVVKNWKMRREYRPSMGKDRRTKLLTSWHRAVAAAQNYR